MLVVCNKQPKLPVFLIIGVITRAIWTCERKWWHAAFTRFLSSKKTGQGPGIEVKKKLLEPWQIGQNVFKENKLIVKCCS